MVENNYPDLFRQLVGRAQAACDELAEEGMKLAVNELNAGSITDRGKTKRSSAALVSDTGAAAHSWYISSTTKMNADVRQSNLSSGRGKTYAEAVAEFAAYYVTRYKGSHLTRRTFEEFKVTPERHKVKAAYATCSVYLGWWEYGHANVFAKLPHKRPILFPVSYFQRRYYAMKFVNLLAR